MQLLAFSFSQARNQPAALSEWERGIGLILSSSHGHNKKTVVIAIHSFLAQHSAKEIVWRLK